LVADLCLSRACATVVVRADFFSAGRLGATTPPAQGPQARAAGTAAFRSPPIEPCAIVAHRRDTGGRQGVGTEDGAGGAKHERPLRNLFYAEFTIEIAYHSFSFSASTIRRRQFDTSILAHRATDGCSTLPRTPDQQFGG